jgi:RimJ/RimL family protein N-acetyltransferase
MRATDIRRATNDDADAITSVIRGVGTPNSGLSGEWDTARVREWIKRLGDDGLIVVAYDGSIPAAFGALDFSTTEPEIGLLGVWVLPEHRRKGLATDIADRLIDHGRERGYRRIRGRLPEGNEPALSFLSAIGAMVPLRNPSMSFELPL